MNIDTSKLTVRELAEVRKLEYGRLKPVKCRLLGNELVYFNKDGFFHLAHNGRGRFRNEADQRMRLNLMPKARGVIARATFYGSAPRMVIAEENRTHKDITFYEVTRRYSTGKAISVILRRIGNGRLHFYSIRYYNKKGAH